MRTYRFTILSLLLLIIFPQVIFQIMASPITAGLSDLAFYLVDYSLFTLGGILGVLLLWKSGFRDIFKMRFRWSYLEWFILLFRKTKCIYYPMVYHTLWNAVPYLMGWR